MTDRRSDELLTELSKAVRERNNLRSYARAMSDMLSGILGSDSEWFKEYGGEYFVCPKAAGKELRRRKTDAQITKRSLIKMNRAKIGLETPHD